MRQIPVPPATPEQTAAIVARVDKILAGKEDNSKADVMELEQEIDRLVCDVYGLTKEEIALVEESTCVKTNHPG
jgi:hypothetical protein